MVILINAVSATNGMELNASIRQPLAHQEPPGPAQLVKTLAAAVTDSGQIKETVLLSPNSAPHQLNGTELSAQLQETFVPREHTLKATNAIHMNLARMASYGTLYISDVFVLLD